MAVSFPVGAIALRTPRFDPGDALFFLILPGRLQFHKIPIEENSSLRSEEKTYMFHRNSIRCQRGRPENIFTNPHPGQFVASMSRAFIKEPDGDQPPEDLPDRMHSPHVNYVTPAGLRQLAERVDHLRSRRQALAGSTAAPDQQQLRIIARDLRYYEERVRRAVLIDPAGQPADEVHFGAVVAVETPEGRRMTFAIVGEDEADAARGKISWVSPLAMALDEARVGDTVTWKRPAGELALTVVAIRPSS
jgi:transcription elongation factor GreB